MVEIRCGMCGQSFLANGPDVPCPNCWGQPIIAQSRVEAMMDIAMKRGNITPTEAELIEKLTQKINQKERDMVAAPPHYTQSNIECKDAIKAALTEAEWRGFCKGNVLKYVWRERGKGKDEDLAKAAVYLGWIKGDK